jgi:hypothetical protein
MFALSSFMLMAGCGGSGDSQASSDSTDTPSATESDQPAPFTKAITKALIADLLQRGDALYDQVSVLPDNTPSTLLAADELVGGEQGLIGSFYVKDRAYQADLPKANLNKDSQDLVTAAGDLAEFETFAYSTAVAVASCNEHDARLNLKVGKAFLDEAHRDFHGAESENWEPPDITSEVTNATQCSE